MKLLKERILLKVDEKTGLEINHMIKHMLLDMINHMILRMNAHMENGNGNRDYNGF